MSNVTSRYVLWQTGVRPGTKGAAGFGDSMSEYDSLGFESVAADFPADAEVRLRAASAPAKVADLLYNTDGVLLLSPRVHALLAPKELPGVELLPLAVVTGDGQRQGLTWYLLHTFGDPACLDWEASKATSDSPSRRWVDQLEAIRLGPDPGRPLLRIRELPQFVLVERGLAAEIAAAGFCGSDLYELDGYADGVEFTGECSLVHAFPGKRELAPIAIGSKGAAKKGKRPKAPPAEVKARVDALPLPAGTRSDAPPYLVDREGLIPLWGGDDWLEAYDRDEWPDFDPKRWFAVGTNGNGNYWLYDLDRGSIVYFSHEVGYDEENCALVDEDWRAFFDRVRGR